MQIRKALPEDKEAISALYAVLFAEMARLQPEFYKAADGNGGLVEQMLDNEQACFFVAQKAGVLTGFALVLEQVTPPYACIHQYSYACLLDMAVLPQCRGQGTGSALLAAAGQWARERGLHHVALHVLEENGRAMRFYERNGFAGAMRTMRSLL